MSDSNYSQGIKKIFIETDETQLKIIGINQCIKARAFLIEKLKNECIRYIEKCDTISRANLILDSEIKTAQDEVKSLTTAHDTLKNVNVELRKELLIVKEDKLEILERIENKKMGYQKIWIECKSRFESIPFVQTYVNTEKRAQNIQAELNTLKKKASELNEKILAKKDLIAKTDRERIIEIANFMRNEMPSKLKQLAEKTKQINDLTAEIDHMKEIKMQGKEKPLKHVILEENQYKTYNSFQVPKWHLDDTDMRDDSISLKLNKIKKTDFSYKLHNGDREFTDKYSNKDKLNASETGRISEVYLSVYFKKPVSDVTKATNKSRKRNLINILEDVKLDKNDAYNLISKTQPEKLKSVNSITPEFGVLNRSQPIVSEVIEEINMSGSTDIVQPPTQFLDTIEKVGNFHEKKRVSFNTSVSNKIHNIHEDVTPNAESDKHKQDNANETANIIIEEGNVDDINRIQEIMVKRDKLNFSPEFVYGKNTKTREDHRIITSKFFKRNDPINTVGNISLDEYGKVEENAKADARNLNETNKTSSDHQIVQKKNETIVSMDIDIPTVNISETKKPGKGINGLFFNHNSQGLPSSLNVSINTTGLDDGEDGYSHCIDKSLLLSPKADLPMITEDPPLLSQEKPNFLSGLRRTVFPFFCPQNATETNSQTKNNEFCFSFGSEEKKNRGGLFNIFK